MTNIVAASTRTRFPRKLICYIAFGSVSSNVVYLRLLKLTYNALLNSDN